MADPFTIIGTTSAVISFVQFAVEVIHTTHSIYDSKTGSTKEHAEIEKITSKTNELLERLSTEEAAAPRSGRNQVLVDLANACRDLGEEIVETLAQAKAKKSKSVLSNLRAGVKTAMVKSTVKDLQERYNRCISLLNLHLQDTMR
jgi:hypothetical protein